MLLVETTRSHGRGLVEGIGRYVGMYGPWSIDFEERGLHEPLPRSLERWRGDGIISRTFRHADGDRLLALQLPVIELYADPELGLPRVFADRARIAEMAVGHFVDRGFRHLAFFAAERAGWVERRLDAFSSEVAKHELSCDVFEPEKKNAGRNRAMEPGIARWVRALPKPCGVYCPFDGFALRLMNVCREIGVAIPEEITRVRLERAAELLRHAPLPIERIAAACGFESHRYFDRVFRRETGMTPRAYRLARRLPRAGWESER